MTQDQAYKIVADAVTKYYEDIEEKMPDNFGLETSLNSIGDSLNLIEIALLIEDKIGVEFPIKKFTEFRVVKDLVDTLVTMELKSEQV